MKWRSLPKYVGLLPQLQNNYRNTCLQGWFVKCMFHFSPCHHRHPPNWESEEWASLAVGPPSCFSRYGETTSTPHGGSIPVSWIGHPHIYHCINERNSHSRFSQRHILNPRKVPKGAKWVKRHRGWAKKKQVRMYTGAQVFWFMCKNKFNS